MDVLAPLRLPEAVGLDLALPPGLRLGHGRLDQFRGLGSAEDDPAASVVQLAGDPSGLQVHVSHADDPAQDPGPEGHRVEEVVVSHAAVDGVAGTETQAPKQDGEPGKGQNSSNHDSIRPTLSYFWGLLFRRSTFPAFIKFVNRRTVWFLNCKRVGRVFSCFH